MKRMYLDFAQKDVFWFETLCKEAGVELEIQDQPDGVTRYLFAETFVPAIQKILDTPEAKRPQQRKASLTSQIGGAQSKTQFPDNPFTRATAEAEKRFNAEKRVAAAQRGELQRPSVRDQLKKPATPPAPPTEIENRWAEEKLAEELQEIEQEIKEADALVASSQEPAAEAAGKQRKKRKSKGRTNQIMTRLTDAELVQFQRRVKKSGLAQGDFLRSAALNGQIVIEEHSVSDVAMLDELAMIRAELGRQGGLLKMIIKPNEGQRELAPEEWAELIAAVRDLEKMKKRLSDLEVKVQHGNREAQDK